MNSKLSTLTNSSSKSIFSGSTANGNFELRTTVRMAEWFFYIFPRGSATYIFHLPSHMLIYFTCSHVFRNNLNPLFFGLSISLYYYFIYFLDYLVISLSSTCPQTHTINFFSFSRPCSLRD